MVSNFLLGFGKILFTLPGWRYCYGFYIIGVHGGRREGADVHREVGAALRLPLRLSTDVPLVLLSSRMGATRRRVCGEIIGRRDYRSGGRPLFGCLRTCFLERLPSRMGVPRRRVCGEFLIERRIHLHYPYLLAWVALFLNSAFIYSRLNRRSVSSVFLVSPQQYHQSLRDDLDFWEKICMV